jgi:hypothetical protein
LKGAVGEQAVEADRDADRGRQVHHRGDDEVGGADEPVPEQDYRGQRGQEGNQYGAKVGDLLGCAHLVHVGQLTPLKAIRISCCLTFFAQFLLSK